MPFIPIKATRNDDTVVKQNKPSSHGSYLKLLKGLLTIASLAALGFIAFDLLSNKDMEGASPVINSSEYNLPSQTESSIEGESIQEKQALDQPQPVINVTRDIED